MGEDAAVQIAAKFAFAQRRGRPNLPVILQRQPGDEVRLHEAVKQRALGVAAVIDGRRGARVVSERAS